MQQLPRMQEFSCAVLVGSGKEGDSHWTHTAMERALLMFTRLIQLVKETNWNPGMATPRHGNAGL